MGAPRAPSVVKLCCDNRSPAYTARYSDYSCLQRLQPLTAGPSRLQPLYPLYPEQFRHYRRQQKKDCYPSARIPERREAVFHAGSGERSGEPKLRTRPTHNIRKRNPGPHKGRHAETTQGTTRGKRNTETQVRGPREQSRPKSAPRTPHAHRSPRTAHARPGHQRAADWPACAPEARADHAWKRPD